MRPGTTTQRTPRRGRRAETGRGGEQAEGRVVGTGHAVDDHLRLPSTRPAGELHAAVDVLASLARTRTPAGHPAAPTFTAICVTPPSLQVRQARSPSLPRWAPAAHER